MTDAPRLPHPPLSLVEARVLGCLCEKEVATPDNYPLSLNALANACNQKSNRHPLLELEESAIDSAIESLRSKQLVFRVSQADARVAKFKHSLERVYPIPDDQRAILTELLLRGPQTIGELRLRCERLGLKATFDQASDIVAQMAAGPFPILRELPRQPGKKDARYAHLLSGEPEIETHPAADAATPLKVNVAIALPPEAEARIAALEATLAEQAAAIEALKADLAAFRSQFE